MDDSIGDSIGELRAPTRLMMTPGPTSIDPRVYRALSTQLVGHMDPWFVGTVITETQELLRGIFQTDNRVTFPLSASGSGGIEASVINPLEPGDEAVIAVNGAFSERMALIAERTGAKIHRVEVPLGRPADPDDVRRAAKGRKVKIVGVCHGETSTGVITPLDGFRQVADELGALLVVDAVATLGGCSAGGGQGANRPLFQQHTKGDQRAAGNVAVYRGAAHRRSPAQSQDAGAELVF